MVVRKSLYHGSILEYARARHGNEAQLTGENALSVTRVNPLCGDRVRLSMLCGDAILTRLAIEARGCALCEASASILGERASGKEIAELMGLEERLTVMMQDGTDDFPAEWQLLTMFDSVRPYRARHGCVLLPFQALTELIRKANS